MNFDEEIFRRNFPGFQPPTEIARMNEQQPQAPFPQHIALFFYPLSDPPAYEERVIFICERKPSQYRAKSKTPVPPSILRIGRLMTTGRNGHNFELEESSEETYCIPVLWAAIPAAEMFPVLSPQPTPKAYPAFSRDDRDDDDESEAIDED